MQQQWVREYNAITRMDLLREKDMVRVLGVSTFGKVGRLLSGLAKPVGGWLVSWLVSWEGVEAQGWTMLDVA